MLLACGSVKRMLVEGGVEGEDVNRTLPAAVCRLSCGSTSRMHFLDVTDVFDLVTVERSDHERSDV